MGTIREVAPAKINLGLSVGGRRPDGYHDLFSLVCFAPISDEIELFENNGLSSLSVSGSFAGLVPTGDENLIHRVDRFLNAVHRAQICDVVPKPSVRLIKNLPVGSGCGGGSADAAAYARAWFRFTPGGKRSCSEISSDSWAADIGADVPVCLRSRPCAVSGIGERVRSIPHLPRFPLVLVFPNEPVSTARVFRKLDQERGNSADRPNAFTAQEAHFGQLLKTLGSRDQWLNLLSEDGLVSNELSQAAIEICPVIGAVRWALLEEHGCRIARMNGSGSSVWGLFESTTQARAASERIQARHPNWWVWGGETLASDDPLPRISSRPLRNRHDPGSTVAPSDEISSV